MMDNSKIKVCVVIPGHWSDTMGGAQYQAQRIVDALIEDGRFEIHYLARSFDANLQPVGYQLDPIHTLFGNRRGYQFLDGPSLLKTLKTIKPNVIYQRVGGSYTGVAAWYAVHSRCRMIWHVAHEMDVTPWGRSGSGISRPWQLVDKKLLEYGIRNVPHIVTQTRDQDELLQQGYHRRASAVIPNFHPFPRETPRKGKRARVVWLANLKRFKRPEIFIDLARDLRGKTDAEFVMVGGLQGSPDWRDNILRRIEETPNLQYVGYLPQEKVNELLSASHILVNTSTAEGFSNAFIQAWMRELPVITLSVNPDALLDDETLGIHAGTYDKLVTSVLALVDDEDRRQRMGSQAAEYARRTHSEANVQDLLELLVP